MQIVEPIVACVTAGLSAPGEHDGSGSENLPGPVAWQEPGPGWGWRAVELACETGSDAGRAGCAGCATSVRPCVGRCRRRGRAARRWPAAEVDADVLVELADEELWVAHAGITEAAMTTAAAATNRRVGTPATLGGRSAGPRPRVHSVAVATVMDPAWRGGWPSFQSTRCWRSWCASSRAPRWSRSTIAPRLWRWPDRTPRSWASVA